MARRRRPATAGDRSVLNLSRTGAGRSGAAGRNRHLGGTALAPRGGRRRFRAARRTGGCRDRAARRVHPVFRRALSSRFARARGLAPRHPAAGASRSRGTYRARRLRSRRRPLFRSARGVLDAGRRDQLLDAARRRSWGATIREADAVALICAAAFDFDDLRRTRGRRALAALDRRSAARQRRAARVSGRNAPPAVPVVPEGSRCAAARCASSILARRTPR